MSEIRDEFLAVVRTGLSIIANHKIAIGENDLNHNLAKYYLGPYFDAQNVPEERYPEGMPPQELASQFIYGLLENEYPEWAMSRR